MSIQRFLMENKINNHIEKNIIVSDRFKDENGNLLEFKIKSLTSQEIVDVDMRAVGNKALQPILLIEKASIEPDFKSVELQKAYEVMGAENLINKILLPGEITHISNEILKLSGFGNTFEELLKEAKKH